MMVTMNTAIAEKTAVPMSEVREWAITKGMPVNASGNLPRDVVDAYNRAHRTKQFVRGGPTGRVETRGRGRRP